MPGASRPLSPHLQVYRWEITMWLSSLHRITGLLLSLAAVALAVWLIALATGPSAFADVQAVYGSVWFKLPLVAWTFCLCLHLTNGIRHLFWDAGLGFDRAQIRKSGWTVVLVTLVATAAVSLVAIV
jgi:succinate dehydrogenase / fumarate reductase, cytochrome b subunit